MPTIERLELKTDNNSNFADIYHKYKDAVLANIKTFVKNDSIAYDILQDVFVTFWENRYKLDSEKNVAGWLFVVSHNKSVNYLKKKVREAIVPEINSLESESIHGESYEEEQEFALKLEQVKAAVNILPARKREAFVRCKLNGEPLEEVSQRMGISIDSLKDYLKQSTRMIRQHLIANLGKGYTAVLICKVIQKFSENQ